MPIPNPVPVHGRQVDYCVPPVTSTEAAPIAGSQAPVDPIPAPGTPQSPRLETAPPGPGGIVQETTVGPDGVVTQPAPVPVGRSVGGPDDAWIVQTATISAVDDDVATSGLVTLSVFTNDPDHPLDVITDVPYGDGQFVPGAWNWPTITPAPATIDRAEYDPEA
jgi:hypothetical protein